MPLMEDMRRLPFLSRWAVEGKMDLRGCPRHVMYYKYHVLDNEVVESIFYG